MVSTCLHIRRQTLTESAHSELQIKRGIFDKDNFSYFSLKKYDVAPHKNHPGKAVLMRGQNICFHGKVQNIIPAFVVLLLYIHSKQLVIRLFLGRLRPLKRLTSTKHPYFCQ